MKMHLTVAVFAAILCAGCAIIPERVDVAYHPDPGVSRVQLTKPVDVILTVSDLRHAESPDWIADKKNGYGMRMASVMAQKPVADLVREAFTQEFNNAASASEQALKS